MKKRGKLKTKIILVVSLVLIAGLIIAGLIVLGNNNANNGGGSTGVTLPNVDLGQLLG